MEHVTANASRQAFQPLQDPSEEEPLVSIETTFMVDFASFAQDYPEKLFPLLNQLRPEFQELFIEYYILHKSQSFLGKTHGCIQTRIWQALRIIEKAIGAFLVFGTKPRFLDMRTALLQVGLDSTPYGSLAGLIARYAESRSYGEVAKAVNAPIPAVRKIFRPAIKLLLASPDIQVRAVGAYLRNLTHQSALKTAGVSKQTLARLARVQNQEFAAPPIEVNPLIQVGDVSVLKGKPWCMLELSSEERMRTLRATLEARTKKTFGKKPVEIFAPLNESGDLLYGYLFARSLSLRATRRLVHVRGVAEIAERCYSEADGDIIPIEDSEVQKLIKQYAPVSASVEKGDFVEILSGPASHYCGTVSKTTRKVVTVKVDFPTGKQFAVAADPSSVKKLSIAPERRTFWGESFISDADHSAPAEEQSE